ncbi:MAG TPA: MerR family DNA-binding transcriptional regulator [Burkholderiales bacterium]|nr:MerR family DNA-binding transcriptional regulator [Burkholderiales bacterium]
MLTIGKVAASLQISTDSIRFYEREGLLRPAEKTEVTSLGLLYMAAM